MSIRGGVVGLISIVLLASNVGHATQEKMQHWITPTIPPIRDEESIGSAPPEEEQILRALPQTVQVPGVYEESRDNIQIVTERILDKLSPPRNYPLVGPAQIHTCHWKCTVYYNETIRCSFPFAFRRTQPRVQVVYIALDHLHPIREVEGQ